MNRFDKPVQYDYSFDRYMPEFYTPNMQLWAGVLEQKKKEDEAMDELLAKSPQYIKTGEGKYLDRFTGQEVTYKYGDSPMMDYYQNIVNDVQKGLEEAALAGDKVLYNRLLKEGQRRIGTEWKTGGVAATLQARYEKLEAEKKRLAEQASKDIEWQSTNYPYAMHQLYQTTVGTYEAPEQGRPVGDANLYPFLNVQEKAIDFAKKLGIHSFDLSKVSIGPNKEFKITEEYSGVPPENVKLLQDYLNSDNFRTQLGIQGFNIAQRYETPQALAAATEQANKRIEQVNAINQEVLDYRQALIDYNSGKSKTAPSEEQAERVRQILAAKGMFSPSGVDMKEGETTNLRNAIDNFYANYEMIDKFENPAGFLDYDIKHQIGNIAQGVLDKKYKWDEQWDQFYLAQKNYGWGASLKQIEHDLYHPKTSNIIAPSGTQTINPEDIQKSYDLANNLYKDKMNETHKIYQSIFGGKAYNQFGGDINKLESMVDKAVEASKNQNGTIDQARFEQSLLSQGLDLRNTPKQYRDLYTQVAGGHFGTLREQRRDAEVTKENAKVILTNARKQAFELWTNNSPGLDTPIRRDRVGRTTHTIKDLLNEIKNKENTPLKNINLDDKKAVFDYLFNTELSNLSESEKVVRKDILGQFDDKQYWKDVKPIQQANVGYTPGQNTDGSKAEKTIGEAFIKPLTLLNSPTWSGKYGKVQLDKVKYGGQHQDAQNRWHALLIPVIDGKDQPPVAVPFSELTYNNQAVEIWRQNLNQDMFTSLGEQGVNTPEFMVAGGTNFNHFIKDKPTAAEFTIESRTKNWKIGHNDFVDFFTMYPDKGGKFEYAIRGYKGQDGSVTYSLEKLTGTDRNNRNSWKEVEGLQRFRSPDVLRGTLANLFVAPERKEKVIQKARNVDDTWMVGTTLHDQLKFKNKN